MTTGRQSEPEDPVSASDAGAEPGTVGGCQTPLSVKIIDGVLRMEIGVATLAYAVRNSDWAHPYNEESEEFEREFEIVHEADFARDVMNAALREDESGTSPTHVFLDRMCEAALHEGSGAVEWDKCIRYGEREAGR